LIRGDPSHHGWNIADGRSALIVAFLSLFPLLLFPLVISAVIPLFPGPTTAVKRPAFSDAWSARMGAALVIRIFRNSGAMMSGFSSDAPDGALRDPVPDRYHRTP
jgi:hypothetical protein